MRAHGCAESAAAVFPETAAACPLEEFAAGVTDAIWIAGLMVLILAFGTGCQKPAATSPGLEAAGANAATIDGTFNNIGYHAQQLRKEFE